MAAGCGRGEGADWQVTQVSLNPLMTSDSMLLTSPSSFAMELLISKEVSLGLSVYMFDPLIL